MQRRRSLLLCWHPTAIAEGGLSQLALPAGKSLARAGRHVAGLLKLRLSLEIAGFLPVFHPFDWRADLEHPGTGTDSAQSRNPAHASAHRRAQHGRPGRQNRAGATIATRRIQRLEAKLGAPNQGSFALVQALRAAYPTVRKIAALDHLSTAEQLARTVFLTLLGLYQMLPSALAPDEPNLFDPAQWPQDDLGARCHDAEPCIQSAQSHAAAG